MDQLEFVVQVMFAVRKGNRRENHDPVSAELDILKESMEESKHLLTLMVMLNSVRNRFLDLDLVQSQQSDLIRLYSIGEYPWQVAILKKDPTESVYVCGGTLISPRHILTAAHCVKTYAARDLRVRLGEWDVNHDVEFYPYIERDVANVHVHPEFYAGTLYNDIAILKINHEIDFQKNPHISPACLPDKRDDFIRSR